jgi:uncharacterized membrane protein
MIAAGLLAHGGTGGLVVEGALLLGLLVIVFAVWRSERRARKKDDEDRARFDSHFEDR